MFNFFLSPFHKAVTFLSFILVSVFALLNYGSRKKKEGREEVKVQELKNDVVIRKNAREAAFKEKRNVDGVSDSDLVDRLRRRGDDWGRL